MPEPWNDLDRQHYDRLDQRRRWLTARIEAKRSVGWDITYDTEERDALTWLLARVGPTAEATTPMNPASVAGPS